MELAYAENPKPFRLFRFGNGIQIYHAEKQLWRGYGKWTIKEGNDGQFFHSKYTWNQMNHDAILGAETTIIIFI